MKVVVIGGVAAGPKTVSRIRRLCDTALTLKQAGFKDVKVVDGGILMWPFEKIVN